MFEARKCVRDDFKNIDAEAIYEERIKFYGSSDNLNCFNIPENELFLLGKDGGNNNLISLSIYTFD